MRDLEKVQFKRAGDRGGEAVFELQIDGKTVAQGLTIDEVIRIIAERDGETDCHASAAALARNDKADRTPAAFRTPEAGRRFETREAEP